MGSDPDKAAKKAMDIHAGGCLCGAVRYETTGDPRIVTICHCRFCQRATGGPYMVEPIFPREHVRVARGSPAVYEQRSAGSGKLVQVHFCAACGTKLYLTFERFPTSCGVYAGTFDEPGWFAITPETTRHIYIDVARPETILPAGMACFGEHALNEDGSLREPVVFGRAQPAAAARRVKHSPEAEQPVMPSPPTA